MQEALRDDGPETPSPVIGPSKPRLLRVLISGLITGASDDDPSGVATCGSTFSFAVLQPAIWVNLSSSTTITRSRPSRTIPCFCQALRIRLTVK